MNVVTTIAIDERDNTASVAQSTRSTGALNVQVSRIGHVVVDHLHDRLLYYNNLSTYQLNIGNVDTRR